MENESNITLRKKPNWRNMSYHNLSEILQKDSDMNSTMLNDSMKSLPNTSAGDNTLVQDLKQQIEELTLQLDSANEEIEKLSLENMTLKKSVEGYERKISIFKKIGVSDNLIMHITSPTVRKIKTIVTAESEVNENNMADSLTEAIAQTKDRDISTDLTGIEPKNVENLEENVSYNYETIPEVTKNDLENVHQYKNQTTATAQLDCKSLTKFVNINDQTKMIEQVEDKSLTNSVTAKNSRYFKSLTQKHDKNYNRNIVILGDQQVSGLSSDLLQSRKGTWNDTYKISAIVKKDASSSEVLASIDNLGGLCKDDKVVLAVGANETNPFSVINALSLNLNKLSNTNVLILPVVRNESLNIDLLNSYIDSIAKLHSNAIFLRPNELKLRVQYNYNIKQFYCALLNYAIDYEDYKNKYLVKKTQHITRFRFTDINVKTKTIKKGTIPYYFDKLQKQSEVKQSQSSIAEFKKGTIPYYFDKLQKQIKPKQNQSSINEVNIANKIAESPNKPKFFRE